MKPTGIEPMVVDDDDEPAQTTSYNDDVDNGDYNEQANVYADNQTNWNSVAWNKIHITLEANDERVGLNVPLDIDNEKQTK